MFGSMFLIVIFHSIEESYRVKFFKSLSENENLHTVEAVQETCPSHSNTKFGRQLIQTITEMAKTNKKNCLKLCGF